jgi:hypothetical protein
VALFTSALGLYGVLSHAVTLQRREIGIRMALGAGVGDVLGHIAARASVVILMGLVSVSGAFCLDRNDEEPALRCLVVSLVAVVGLAKMLSPAIERAVEVANAPRAVVGIVIASLVLLPETWAAVRAARANRGARTRSRSGGGRTGRVPRPVLPRRFDLDPATAFRTSRRGSPSGPPRWCR